MNDYSERQASALGRWLSTDASAPGTTVLDIDASTGAVSVLMQNTIGHIVTNRRNELVSGFPL